MLTTLNRHVVLPLIAARRRSRHLNDLRLLEQTQYDPFEVVEARQLKALQRMLRHAFETVPLYRERWTKAGIHPYEVRSLDDFKQFPILTKTDIRTQGESLLSSAFDKSKLRLKTTSGSTGVPLRIRIAERDVQWKYACTLRSDQWSGWKLGQRVAKVWGNPEYRQFGLRGRITNRLVDRAVHLDTCELTAERIETFTKTLRRHQPGLIFGHAHSLYLLACELRDRGIDDIRPNGIISTAMPLHHWQRVVIEEVFGTQATNRYGCEEVSLIASECEVHDGLHIAAESVYVEMPGIVTDLSNYAMPLIRYEIGDVLTAKPGRCACGRGLPMLATIEGRDADYVTTPSGTRISGISLTENYALHIPGTAQVQIIQETPTFLRLRLVRDEHFSDASRRQIATLTEQLFGPAMRHEVELVEKIAQEPSGKYRFCISNV